MITGFRSSRLVKCRIIPGEVLAGTEITGGGGWGTWGWERGGGDVGVGTWGWERGVGTWGWGCGAAEDGESGGGGGGLYIYGVLAYFSKTVLSNM